MSHTPRSFMCYICYIVTFAIFLLQCPFYSSLGYISVMSRFVYVSFTCRLRLVYVSFTSRLRVVYVFGSGKKGELIIDSWMLDRCAVGYWTAALLDVGTLRSNTTHAQHTKQKSAAFFTKVALLFAYINFFLYLCTIFGYTYDK